MTQPDISRALDLLSSATRAADEARAQAQVEAAEILTAARRDADKIRRDADTQIEQVRSNAIQDANRIRREAEQSSGQLTAAAQAQKTALEQQVGTLRAERDKLAHVLRSASEAANSVLSGE